MSSTVEMNRHKSTSEHDLIYYSEKAYFSKCVLSWLSLQKINSELQFWLPKLFSELRKKKKKTKNI